MSVLTRSNYIPNTLIQSAAVNTDFNQLVDLLSGVSTTKDALIKFNHATDPVLRLDQLGAGIIERWLQNGTEKARVNNDGSFNIGTPGGSPTNGLVAGPESSGSNIAGAHLDLHGGRGTGNAIPGQLAARYPLIGASGTSLQSLSTERFPLSTSLYTNTAIGTAVANTTNETSIFTGATASAGSTLTIQAGSVRPGTVIRLRLYGTFATTGTPTIRIKVKLGTVAVIDTGASTSPNNANGLFFIDVYIYVNAVGASGLVRGDFEGRLTVAVSGTPAVTHIYGAAGEPTVDFTANQAIDVTAQWGTASASNSIGLLTASIERYR